jgi:hypothetical protein
MSFVRVTVAAEAVLNPNTAVSRPALFHAVLAAPFHQFVLSAVFDQSPEPSSAPPVPGLESQVSVAAVTAKLASIATIKNIADKIAVPPF